MAKRTIVCGSGPAGLSAALAACEKGDSVLLVEKELELSRKLLASGNGRCNFSNDLPANEFMARFGREGRFMTECLRAGSKDWLFSFLREHGVQPELTNSRYWFPASGRASDVRDAFLCELRRLGCGLRVGTRIASVSVSAGAVRNAMLSNGETIPCERLILACGGTAAPQLGGSDSGLELARSLGHSIRSPRPALAPIPLREAWTHALSGVSLTDAELVCGRGRFKRRERGELLFTHDGVSGPAALNLSADAAALFQRDGECEIQFNPHAGTRWTDFLSLAREKVPKRLLRSALRERIPASLADVLCETAGLSERCCQALDNATIERFARALSAIPLHVAGTAPMTKAMAMAGGVSLKEVDPRTMESRIVRGLRFAGEILDLTGPCGGFNIQFAFSSGRLAGSAEQDYVSE